MTGGPEQESLEQYEESRTFRQIIQDWSSAWVRMRAFDADQVRRCAQALKHAGKSHPGLLLYAWSGVISGCQASGFVRAKSKTEGLALIASKKVTSGSLTLVDPTTGNRDDSEAHG